MNKIDTIENKLIKHLNDQRKTGQFCDVIFKLNNNFKISAHFCIIAAQSSFVGGKYFISNSNLKFSIHNPLTIEIFDFDCNDCLIMLFDFFYSKDITITKDHESHILTLSKMLEVQELTRILCKDEIINQTPTNINSQIQISVPSKVSNKTYDIPCKSQNRSSQTKMHFCHGCNFKCYKPSVMLSHIKSCISSCTRCSLCDTDLHNIGDFKNHLVKHEHEKPFFCVDCDLRFITRTGLNLHLPKHSSETPFICSHCGKGFKWKHGLISHLVVHSKEKKLLCDECGFKTAHLKTLRAHKLSHNGNSWRCTVIGCSYTTRRKENLKIHIATHRKETPFVCEVCGHCFSQSKNLKRHALLHLSKNLYKCPHCSFGSHRSDKLREHVNRQHTEKPILLELSEYICNNNIPLNVKHFSLLLKLVIFFPPSFA